MFIDSFLIIFHFKIFTQSTFPPLFISLFFFFINSLLDLWMSVLKNHCKFSINHLGCYVHACVLACLRVCVSALTRLLVDKVKKECPIPDNDFSLFLACSSIFLTMFIVVFLHTQRPDIHTFQKHLKTNNINNNNNNTSQTKSKHTLQQNE